MTKRVFSGMQSTGLLHLGNYLGALKQWIPLQEDYDAFYCVVDLHALTVPRDPAELHRDSLTVANLYLAAGLDPNKATLFLQSHVPAHAELAWLLTCQATMGELSRMTQFKDKSHGDENPGVGLFAYPVLMAADILLYDADLVPVGDDQKQHLELTRDLAGRFNHRYGETFKLPQPVIAEQQAGARIMGLDDPTKKMSKSAPSPLNYISLLDSADTIAKKIKRAVTDSGREVRYDPENKPAISNLMVIFSQLSGLSLAEIEAKFAGGPGYGPFKKELAEVVIEAITPIGERYRQLEADGVAREVLAKGAERARAVAEVVLRRAKERLGLVLPTEF